jgi:large subunit ribosomal protein L29
MKAREISELATKELQERLVAEKESLQKMKINHSVSPLDNPSKINQTRKNVARISTELRKREINAVK